MNAEKMPTASTASVIISALDCRKTFAMPATSSMIAPMKSHLPIELRSRLITLAVLAVGIFSAFILYDLKRVRDGLETNYITATLGVYLSLYNVFQSLLMLLGLGGSREE